MISQGREAGRSKDARPQTGRRLALLACCAAAALSLALPGAASAAFGLHSLSAIPDDIAAGANSDFHLHIGFAEPTEQVRNLTIHLPPGVVGNPTSPALCTAARLNADDCPPASAVGSVATATTVWVLKPVVGVPLNVSGSIYNLEPRQGEPARFGIVLRPPLSDLGVLPKITMQSAARLRTSDYGLDTVLEDIPSTSGGLAVDILSMDITLRGNAGNPLAPFMRNPTSCVPATTRFSASSYAQPDQVVTGEASFTPTDCDKLPFSPRLSASVGSPGHTADGSSPPLTTVIQQAPTEAGLRDATVLLPPGVGAANDALSSFCAMDQFLAGGCPSTTVLGSASARSPLLPDALAGPVVLVAPAAVGQLPQLGLDLRGQLHLQLLGSFVVTGAGPGNSFVGLPDIPISRFELSFDEDHLISSTRNLCRGDPPTFHADYAAHSGAAFSEDAAATVNGCGGSRGADPKATVRLVRPGSRQPRLRFKASAGATALRGAKLKLPGGLRFAGGKEWAEGAKARADGKPLSANALKHGRRTMRLNGPGSGSDTLVASVGGEALRRTSELPAKLRFRVSLTDVDGDATKLLVKARRSR